jgi:hypothetical protein
VATPPLVTISGEQYSADGSASDAPITVTLVEGGSGVSYGTDQQLVSGPITITPSSGVWSVDLVDTDNQAEGASYRFDFSGGVSEFVTVPAGGPYQYNELPKVEIVNRGM